ncbi:MAG: TAXI family TRAP transporter solute-binding subunit [Chloroflexi bacterium]|nr:TAXI family TRAP transporter solute-binding subunit [Chloroflexota bacterium]
MKTKRMSIALGSVIVLALLAGALGCQQPATTPAPAPAPKPAPATPAPKPSPTTPAAPSPTPAPKPSPTATAHPPYELTSMSAAFASGFYTISQGIERLLTQKHPWLRAYNQETPGYEYNLKYVMTNPGARAKSIFAMAEGSRYTAENGLSIFSPTKYDTGGIKYIMALYASIYWFNTLDPKIKTLQDLSGKKVAFAAKGATNGEPLYWLVSIGGGVKDIKAEYVGQDKAPTYLLDGLVDAAMGLVIGDPGDPKTMQPPPNYIEMFNSGRTIYYIPLPKQSVEKLRKEHGYPFPFTQLIPANTYKYQTEPLEVAGSVNTLGASSELPDEVVYEYVKFILNNLDDVRKTHGSLATLTKSTLGMAGRKGQYHPGAIKALEEAGIKVGLD